MQTTYRGKKIEIYLSEYNGSWCIKIDGKFRAGGFLKEAGARKAARRFIDDNDL